MIPERKTGENIYQFINRAATELRESRSSRLADQCARIEEKAGRRGRQQEEHPDTQHPREAR